jgi:hypothetical protein
VALGRKHRVNREALARPPPVHCSSIAHPASQKMKKRQRFARSKASFTPPGFSIFDNGSRRSYYPTGYIPARAASMYPPPDAFSSSMTEFILGELRCATLRSSASGYIKYVTRGVRVAYFNFTYLKRVRVI